VTLIVFAFPVMLRRRTMCLCGVLVVFGSFGVGFLWHLRSIPKKTAHFPRGAASEHRRSWWSCSVNSGILFPAIFIVD
jgi:hypothetical protein